MKRLLNMVFALARHSPATIIATKISAATFCCGIAFSLLGGILPYFLLVGVTFIILSPILVVSVLCYVYSALRKPTKRRETHTVQVATSELDLSNRNPTWAYVQGIPSPVRHPTPSTINVDGTNDAVGLNVTQVTHEVTKVDVVLIPSARYHVIELAPFAKELRAKGMNAILATVGPPPVGIAAEAFTRGEEVYVLTPDTAPPLALITQNDWGPTRAYAERYKSRGTVLIAKVEGAQDFRNVDTPRWRYPYSSSDLVLAQGAFDVRNVMFDNVEVVGSSRIEELISLRRDGLAERAVRQTLVNLNFSYGTYTSATHSWLRQVSRGTQLAGVTMHVSVHPAVNPTLVADDVRSAWPLALDLETSKFLVTRASTALFDSLALGRRPIYFNPHGERVWADVPWTASVPRVTTADELAHSLLTDDTLELQSERLAFLFDNFVSFDEHRPACQRSADAVLSHL